MPLPAMNFDQADVIEDYIFTYDSSILKLLLKDKASHKNILWATTEYEDLGPGYKEYDEIFPELIIGTHTLLIQPRSVKSRQIQEERTREKAEVFTPSWICNQQNNLVDSQWFGKKDVFNTEDGEYWTATEGKIPFSETHKTWKKYVDAQRLEISCGEAPYLISRYDSVTGEMIPIKERIGIFDRKMRIVAENAKTDEEWIQWSIRAVQSVFGYEYQGDSLLLARENMLLSYIDYYIEHFQSNPDHYLLKKIANIIAWNLWQMDGMKYVVPNSCHEEEIPQIGLFAEQQEKQECLGCRTGNPYKHNGIYCRIKDWRSNKNVRFIDMMKGATS